MDVVEMYDNMVSMGFDSDYALNFVADVFQMSYDDAFNLLFYL